MVSNVSVLLVISSTQLLMNGSSGVPSCFQFLRFWEGRIGGVSGDALRDAGGMISNTLQNATKLFRAWPGHDAKRVGGGVDWVSLVGVAERQPLCSWMAASPEVRGGGCIFGGPGRCTGDEATTIGFHGRGRRGSGQGQGTAWQHRCFDRLLYRRRGGGQDPPALRGPPCGLQHMNVIQHMILWLCLFSETVSA